MNLTILSVCKKCGTEKELDLRYNLYKPRIPCSKKHQQKYYQNHKEETKERVRLYISNNPNKRAEYSKRYYKKKKESSARNEATDNINS